MHSSSAIEIPAAKIDMSRPCASSPYDGICRKAAGYLTLISLKLTFHSSNGLGMILPEALQCVNKAKQIC